MNRGKKTKKIEMEKHQNAEYIRRKREREAEYRRELLVGMTPKGREFAVEEFAKLGLKQ